MGKTLCEYVDKKLPEKDPEKYAKMVKDAKYFCARCGRAANKEKNVCKPEKI